MDLIITISVAVVCCILAFFAGSMYRKKIAEAKIGGAEQKAKAILEEAAKKADSKKTACKMHGICHQIVSSCEGWNSCDREGRPKGMKMRENRML